MRGMAVLSLLLCAAHATPPEDGCVLAADPVGVESAGGTGVPELDKRIETERRFLETVFGVRAGLVIFNADAPQRAFVVVREDGSATVFLSRARLRQLWEGEHRVVAVAAVLAHQCAHILQGKLKCVPEHSCEEHADLLAGWYLGRRNIAALQDGEDGDQVFDSSAFTRYREFLTTRFDQLEPPAETVRRGFDLLRLGRVRLDAMCLEGLDLEPPAPPAKKPTYTPLPYATQDEDDEAADDDAGWNDVAEECHEARRSRRRAEPEREWVPGHYESQWVWVWVPPHCEEVFEPEVIGPRDPSADPHGRFAHRMGLIREARRHTVEVPGQYETVWQKVWVEGYYR